MAETLQEACTIDGFKKWHWYNIQRDLVEQGGLEERSVSIDPSTVRESMCGGQYYGMPFVITWVKDRFLLLSFETYATKLVNAFSAVVEYKPFAKYKEPDNGLTTVEWDKIDPEGRFQDLQQEGKINLRRIRQ